MTKMVYALTAVALVALTGSTVHGAIISGSGFVANTEIDDYFFSVTAAGIVTIDVTETIDDLSDFDSQINLFRDDGLLDVGDFIANNDDGGGGPSGLESRIVVNLAAGDYLLRVGTHTMLSSAIGPANLNAAFGPQPKRV